MELAKVTSKVNNNTCSNKKKLKLKEVIKYSFRRRKIYFRMPHLALAGLQKKWPAAERQVLNPKKML